MTKRPASANSPTPVSAKKRRIDNMQKFYAVRAGFTPGVYLTYAECQAQTAGFKGAVFKSFVSREDAEAFAAGKKVEAAPGEPDKFYAVAVGSPTGIFTDWAEASQAIKGVKGPKYKRFNTRAEAVGYIKQYGAREAVEALGETVSYSFESAEDDDEDEDQHQHQHHQQHQHQPHQHQQQQQHQHQAGHAAVMSTRELAKKARAARDEDILRLGEDILDIYTDGSSLANGKAGSRAGLGVYFGDGDARNVSERLQGEPQTNQRAELMAMFRALEIAPLEQTVRIFSDSQYSIKCVTEWAAGWKKKGWLTATGEKVKNQDIIRAVLDKMEERTNAGGKTYFQWVKGHSTDLGNVAADRLAVRGAKTAS
ncbi:Ribonuclease H [Escovopsis weberi]|uniref:Ribonuclease H n=1 Tax=Escovopsis weberi TaxID=150374 RepID=A0A0M8N771_ESCWE|nr:Ribonuclease H [Escovopsis weberi]